MLCESWEKGWWATGLHGKKKDHHRINGTRSPPAGTALRVPVKQVRSTHEHRHSASMGTDKYLSVCIHLVLLTKVKLLRMYYMPGPVLVAWATHRKKMKTPGPYNLQRFCNLRGWACVCTRESTVHTYTPDQEPHQIKSVGVNHLPSSSQVIVSKAFAELQEPIKQSRSHNAC